MTSCEVALFLQDREQKQRCEFSQEKLGFYAALITLQVAAKRRPTILIRGASRRGKLYVKTD